jgi:hypothetical protein
MTLLLIPQQAAAAPLTVVDFGATPDDRQDDTAAMQKAADYLCTHPGTTLVYPPGVYKLDKNVDRDTYFSALGSGDLSQIGIFYNECHDVKITGFGAKIDVKGDFEKTALEPIDEFNHWSVDKMAFNAFIFRDSYNFTVSGFEIDGNVEKMTQSVPETKCDRFGNVRVAQLQENYEDGIFIVSGHDFSLNDLFIHHMATDGILLGLAKNVEIRGVTVANNIRQALSIGQGRNILVTDGSELRDTGVVGTCPNSYPLHSPGRGVDIEPECFPKNAEWRPIDPETGKPAGRFCDGTTGNILFDNVRVTGNLGGGIAMGHGASVANVTVRNSFLQNPLAKGGVVVDMGIVGGIVKDSTLDAQNGFGVFCITDGVPAQLTSPVWASYLQDLASDPSPSDPSPIAKIIAKMYRQTDPTFSTTIQNNTIRGQGTKFRCENATPVMKVVNNTIEGTLLVAPPEKPYPTFGHMIIFSGTPGAQCSTGHEWGKELTIEGNDIFIPYAYSAPRDQPYGQINYCGTKLKLANNTYRTDTEDPATPLRVYYNRAEAVGSVAGDCFPASGAIIAVDEAGTHYPLTPKGTQQCLTLP